MTTCIDRFIYNACTFLTEQELCDILSLTNEDLCSSFYDRIEDIANDSNCNLTIDEGGVNDTEFND